MQTRAQTVSGGRVFEVRKPGSRLLQKYTRMHFRNGGVAGSKERLEHELFQIGGRGLKTEKSHDFVMPRVGPTGAFITFAGLTFFVPLVDVVKNAKGIQEYRHFEQRRRPQIFPCEITLPDLARRFDANFGRFTVRKLFEADRARVWALLQIAAKEHPSQIWLHLPYNTTLIEAPFYPENWPAKVTAYMEQDAYARIHTSVVAETREYLIARREVSGNKSFRLLDVGCGEGSLLCAIRQMAAENGLEIETYGFDVNNELVLVSRGKGLDRIKLADAGAPFDFSDSFFDVVISCGLANCMVVTPKQGEHIKDEMYRVAKPGALTIFTGITPVVPLPGKYHALPIQGIGGRYAARRLAIFNAESFENSFPFYSLVKV